MISGIDLQFEPYLNYRASITQIENFAEQSRFCYRIALGVVGEPGTSESSDPATGQAFGQISDVLHSSCFLCEWHCFGVFMRSTVRSMLQAHPSVLASLNPERTISYGELLTASDGLSSLAKLRNTLITAEIERRQAGGRSVIGLIDFLKQYFHLRIDPYAVEYLDQGHRSTASRRELELVGEICALLSRECPRPSAIAAYPQLIWREQAVVVTESYFNQSKHMLNAIAAEIARCVEHRWYEA